MVGINLEWKLGVQEFLITIPLGQAIWPDPVRSIQGKMKCHPEIPPEKCFLANIVEPAFFLWVAVVILWKGLSFKSMKAVCLSEDLYDQGGIWDAYFRIRIDHLWVTLYKV